MKITYKQSKNISQEETQWRLDRAFDILFTAVIRRHPELLRRKKPDVLPSKEELEDASREGIK